MGWQPIETAPKDGTQIIVWGSSGDASVVEYYMAEDGFCGWEIARTASGTRLIMAASATHWRPLPEPPK